MKKLKHMKDLLDLYFNEVFININFVLLILAISFSILSSCTSYRVVLQTELKAEKIMEPGFRKKIIDNFNPTEDMELSYRGISKYCYGKDLEGKPITICFKEDKIYLLTIYVKKNHKDYTFSREHLISHLSQKEKVVFDYHERFISDIQKEIDNTEKKEEVYDLGNLDSFYKKLIE